MSQPQPVFFNDNTGQPLFGWLHVPGGGRQRDLGLVICNPFGNESICANRSLRHLAESASGHGFATLRFDYHGTGDSAGNDLEAGRVAAWLESVRAAIRFLRESTSVNRSALLGLRLGATLAAFATTGVEVDAMIAIAPVLNARGYLRELRALQLAMDARRGIERPADASFETGGFEISRDTQTALATLDLVKGETAAARNVLIFDRPGVPPSDAWAARLRERGAAVEQRNATGFAEMMLDSHEGIVPRAMFDESLQWLANIAGAPQTRPPGAVKGSRNTRLAAAGADSPAPSIEERIVQIGDAGLFGILSGPVAQPQCAPLRAIVLVNSGAVHHIGPDRMYVTLARRWAALGCLVLRLDLGGLGDSPPRTGEAENVVYSRYATRDLADAVEYLKRECGAAEVHALGICSGAYHSFKSAVAGVPLASVVLINPLTFFWREGLSLAFPEYRIAQDMQRYRTNVFRLQSWGKLLRGQVNLLELAQVLARRVQAVASAQFRSAARMLGVKLSDDLHFELRAATGAGAKLRFVFAAGEPGLALLRDQGGRTVTKLLATRQLEIDIVEGANHTFTDREARDRLTAVLSRHLDPAPQPSRP